MREPLPKTDHPRGLNPEERKEWHDLCTRLFELYEKMPIGETKRKFIGGTSEHNMDTILIMFKGSVDDVFKIREIL
jgi:hypothetical protein